MEIVIDWELKYKDMMKSIRQYYSALDTFGATEKPTEKMLGEFNKRDRYLRAASDYRKYRWKKSMKHAN